MTYYAPYMYESHAIDNHPTLFGDTTCNPQALQALNAQADEDYGGKQMPCYSNWNRPSEYDFFSGDYWRENNFFSFGNGSDHNVCDDSMEKGGLDQCDEDCTNYISCQEDVENHPSCDNDSCSNYKTWFGYGGEKDDLNQGAQESIVPYSYSQDEMGFYESIFGNWPCFR
ncbi:hypothetical protein O6P43_006740 [Quillaja saponaria]|uniref:Uncharacterized protein n=1 Tax=Quillaja saponaria TaxID=32244 RepID=A0AAD7VII2_QUISA|nr:hypothetical protein O6P43_006740 [Quillaja saponaria]